MSDQKCAACGRDKGMHGEFRLARNGELRACSAFTPPAEVKTEPRGPAPLTHEGRVFVVSNNLGSRRYKVVNGYEVPLDEPPPVIVAADAGPEWLDAPTHDGWWWLATDDRLLGCYRMEAASPLKPDHWNIPDDRKPKVTYADATPPTPPPPALPKSREVKLSSDVIKRSYGWQARVYADTALIKCNTEHSDYVLTKEQALELAREWSGCEPTVEGAE